MVRSAWSTGAWPVSRVANVALAMAMIRHLVPREWWALRSLKGVRKSWFRALPLWTTEHVPA